MGVLEFLSDRRFHRSFVVPPNPSTGRNKSQRVSFSDFGDPNSNAVVLLCGALMGMRLTYSPLDQLAKANNVRMIHPDRPGVGGSDPVDLDQRISFWLEMVPQLLKYLDITHVALASHSGGDIYLLNTLLTHPYLLHPQNPYACFFAPWVHPSHTKVTHMMATELLPASMIGQFASLAKFVNGNVVPLVSMSGGILDGIKGSLLRSRTAPGPVSLAPNATSSRVPSGFSAEDFGDLSLDDPVVVEELRNQIATFMFAESLDGVSADAQLFMRKPRTLTWCSPDNQWSDIDVAVSLFSNTIRSQSRKWTIDAFHAETDGMVGEKGKQWFDNCWQPEKTSHPQTAQEASELPYDYKINVVKDGDHDLLMDPAFGASEAWLKRVRAMVPMEQDSSGPISGAAGKERANFAFGELQDGRSLKHGDGQEGAFVKSGIVKE